MYKFNRFDYWFEKLGNPSLWFPNNLNLRCCPIYSIGLPVTSENDSPILNYAGAAEPHTIVYMAASAVQLEVSLG